MFTAAGFEKTFAYIELFKQGLVCTVSLSLLTVIFGFILALLLAVMRLSDVCPFRYLALTRDGHLRDRGFLAVLSRFNPVRFLATVYVEIFRATPMLVQLFIVYYVAFDGVDLPSFKLFGFIRFDRFLPGVVALALNSGAYLSEIIRAGIQSIDGGGPVPGSLPGTEHAVHHSAPGYQEHPPSHCQRVRHHHQGVLHLLYHRRAGDHVCGDFHQGRHLPHRGAPGHRHAGLFLPYLPHQQDHCLL